jgi:hypothetical protein
MKTELQNFRQLSFKNINITPFYYMIHPIMISNKNLLLPTISIDFYSSFFCFIQKNTALIVQFTLKHL